MGHFFCNNNLLKEYIASRFSQSSIRINIWSIDHIEPNDYMPTYLFDVIQLERKVDQFSERELQETNPDWYKKNWEFVKQMADAGHDVLLYSGQWYEYLKNHKKFVRCAFLPKLKGAEILLFGDGEKLSFTSSEIVKMLMQRVIYDKEHNLRLVTEQDLYERLCNQLIDDNSHLL